MQDLLYSRRMADIESWETQVLRDHTEMLEIALVPELLFVANEMN